MAQEKYLRAAHKICKHLHFSYEELSAFEYKSKWHPALNHSAIAWAKLLRHWSSFRWDDSMGVRPADLQLRARGLFGLLERSKTSGPDKAVKVLPIFVSKLAWVATEWLDTLPLPLSLELTRSLRSAQSPASASLSHCSPRVSPYS